MAKKSVVSLRENQHAFAKALVGAGRFPSGSAALHPLRSSPLEWLRHRSELLDSDSDASAGFCELFEVGDLDAPAQQRDWP